MGYGSPESIGEVADYLANIKSKHALSGPNNKPTSDEIEHLKMRYTAIGGKSPFNKITHNQASALEALLLKHGVKVKVYVGMKHSNPSISDAVGRMADDGINTIIGLPLAPYYSSISTGGYKKELTEAAERQGHSIKVSFVNEWNTNSMFLKYWEDSIKKEIRNFKDAEKVFLLFTAHSLPEEIRKHNDPYPDQFEETSRILAESIGIKNWSIAYQSGRPSGWLGPDIKDKLKSLRKDGYCSILIAPIGFVTENLETLYDIDIVCISEFKKERIDVRRTGVPDTDPIFIEALASIIVGKLG